MICPKCGHDTDGHGLGGCCYADLVEGYLDACTCQLTEVEALRAAQRHSAAVRLWKWDKSGRAQSIFCYLSKEWKDAIDSYQIAIRDCGIQRPRQKDSKK